MSAQILMLILNLQFLIVAMFQSGDVEGIEVFKTHYFAVMDILRTGRVPTPEEVMALNASLAEAEKGLDTEGAHDLDAGSSDPAEGEKAA